MQIKFNTWAQVKYEVTNIFLINKYSAYRLYHVIQMYL